MRGVTIKDLENAAKAVTEAKGKKKESEVREKFTAKAIEFLSFFTGNKTEKSFTTVVENWIDKNTIKAIKVELTLGLAKALNPLKEIILSKEFNKFLEWEYEENKKGESLFLNVALKFPSSFDDISSLNMCIDWSTNKISYAVDELMAIYMRFLGTIYGDSIANDKKKLKTAKNNLKTHTKNLSGVAEKILGITKAEFLDGLESQCKPDEWTKLADEKEAKSTAVALGEAYLKAQFLKKLKDNKTYKKIFDALDILENISEYGAAVDQLIIPEKSTVGKKFKDFFRTDKINSIDDIFKAKVRPLICEYLKNLYKYWNWNIVAYLNNKFGTLINYEVNLVNSLISAELSNELQRLEALSEESESDLENFAGELESVAKALPEKLDKDKLHNDLQKLFDQLRVFRQKVDKEIIPCKELEQEINIILFDWSSGLKFNKREQSLDLNMDNLNKAFEKLIKESYCVSPDDKS